MLQPIRFLILLLIIPASTHAQQIIKGMVADSATYSPLPYVNIQLKNTFKGTSTDQQGNFSIMATKEDTLVLSRIGYRRVEIPLYDYETALILMPELVTQLGTVTVTDSRHKNPYEGMFDDQNAALVYKKLPFYYSRAKKQKIRLGRLKQENMRVQTYLDVVVHDPSTKDGLMKKFGLTEEEYYRRLTAFNEQHYSVMYYLTAAELTSLLNQFFESQR